VRIGVLGAGRWAPTTLLTPAKDNTEVVVAAVASSAARSSISRGWTVAVLNSTASE